MPTILFTGGGTAGHTTPNLALIKRFQEKGWDVFYAGSKNGIEKDIITNSALTSNISYHAISAGKLRRQFSFRNFLSPFRIMLGIAQAFFLCKKLKPDVLFSKGGFVAFPAVVGAWLNKIPIITHESDLTPGLANRLTFPFAKKICITFQEGARFFKNKEKLLVTGTPLRESLFHGDANKGLAFCGFDHEKPVLLVMGGGQGATNINRSLFKILPRLLNYFQIVHLCGKGKIDPQFTGLKGYKPLEYLHEELPDVFACTNLVISRAGANSIYELLALRIPHLLIPLSKAASRGDQIQNADYFAKQKMSAVLFEEDLTDEKLFDALLKINGEKEEIRQRLESYPLPDSVTLIYNLIEENI